MWSRAANSGVRANGKAGVGPGGSDTDWMRTEDVAEAAAAGSANLIGGARYGQSGGREAGWGEAGTGFGTVIRGRGGAGKRGDDRADSSVVGRIRREGGGGWRERQSANSAPRPGRPRTGGRMP